MGASRVKDGRICDVKVSLTITVRVGLGWVDLEDDVRADAEPHGWVRAFGGIVIESRIGRPPGRLGYERQYFPGIEWVSC